MIFENNKDKYTYHILFLLLISFPLFSQPQIEWQKSLGGSDLDEAYSIQQTTDDGYIIAGKTNSENGDVSGYSGNQDFWVVKLNSIGDMEWQKCLLSPAFEVAYSIQQTFDGGYIVAGATDGGSAMDVLVVKLDALGEIQWDRILGGSEFESAYSVRQTQDGGYMLAGESGSTDGDVTENKGLFDVWIVKLDTAGNVQWQKSLGGTQDDRANAIRITADGGFIIAGLTFSDDVDVSGNAGLNDFWVVRLDSAGNIQWQNALGGTFLDEAMSIEPTMDGGFIAVGYSYSNDVDVTINYGNQDIWIVKLNHAGEMEWQKSFGGSKDENAFSVDQTTDGGFIVAGGSNSPNDGDITGNQGKWDYWIIKLDESGNLQWQQSYGGSNFDIAYSVQQTTEDGFIVAGYSNSDDGDISENHGSRDYWIVKLTPLVNTEENILPTEIEIYPNPAKTTINYISDKVESWDQIEILNNMGMSVRKLSNEEKKQIEIHDLAEGIYFIRFTNSNKTVIKKFLKTN